MLKGNFLKKGQVWIETVVYTLIGLSIIAIILTMAMPQIDKMKDKSVVEQTATALNELKSQLRSMDVSLDPISLPEGHPPIKKFIPRALKESNFLEQKMAPYEQMSRQKGQIMNGYDTVVEALNPRGEKRPRWQG